jgi:CMP-N,N'-diacetyllegionaminic acid synthase
VNKLKKSVAFIPARAGSKRIQDKNIKLLEGHPLLAYAIQAALDSEIFDDVICATDSHKYAEIARYYGAEVPTLRSPDISADISPDIEWVVWLLEILKDQGRAYEAYSILRPTSPFRLAETIQRAWNVFNMNPEADSLRAVEKCKQHPGKMWVIRNGRMLPVMPFQNGNTPWHSSQYASLPEVYVQNASLEISWAKVAIERRSISGESIIPFISDGLEGFDLNDPEDWVLAEHYINENAVRLPAISRPAYKNIG